MRLPIDLEVAFFVLLTSQPPKRVVPSRAQITDFSLSFFEKSIMKLFNKVL